MPGTGRLGSFELAPDTPIDFEGSEVDFHALRHTKTLKAHEVLHLAKTEGIQRVVDGSAEQTDNHGDAEADAIAASPE